jgi:hypothetical protein
MEEAFREAYFKALSWNMPKRPQETSIRTVSPQPGFNSKPNKQVHAKHTHMGVHVQAHMHMHAHTLYVDVGPYYADLIQPNKYKII